MNAKAGIATRDEGALVTADATSIMAVISRAASDPQTDVGKLERLTALYERIVANTAKAAFTAALSEMQPELPVITAADPDKPKRSGWWARAKANLSGN